MRCSSWFTGQFLNQSGRYIPPGWSVKMLDFPNWYWLFGILQSSHARICTPQNRSSSLHRMKDSYGLPGQSRVMHTGNWWNLDPRWPKLLTAVGYSEHRAQYQTHYRPQANEHINKLSGGLEFSRLGLLAKTGYSAVLLPDFIWVNSRNWVPSGILNRAGKFPDLLLIELKILPPLIDRAVSFPKGIGFPVTTVTASLQQLPRVAGWSGRASYGIP